MSTADSEKQKASYLNDMKDTDDDTTGTGSTIRVAAAAINDIDECGCSVEDMLAVPMEYIFRDVSTLSTSINTNTTDAVSVGWSPATPRTTLSHPNPRTPSTTVQQQNHQQQHQHRTKPLLSRIEAQLFLQVHTLSYEMDALTTVSMTALQQRLTCRDFGRSLQRVDHPYLRPLVAFLYNYQEQMPRDTIQQVSSLLKERMIPEFQRVVQQLRQFSEQNWTLADTLDDGQPTMGGINTGCSTGSIHGSTGYHHVLAQEKRKLSDLQEEVCQRIETLLLQVSEHHDEASPVDDELEVSTHQPQIISMKDYCDQLFQPQSDCATDHIETTTGMENVIVHHDTHHPMEMTAANPTKTSNEHFDEDDDEVLEEAPDRSITTDATPISSPEVEESPTLMESTSKTRASVLRNAKSTPTTSPLWAMTTTTTATDAAPSTTKAPPPPSDNPTTEPSSATRATNTSRDVAPQRQLEKSFGSVPAAAAFSEENEKENEPSQSSSQRSSLSRSTPATTASTSKRPRLLPESLSPPLSSERISSPGSEFLATSGSQNDRWRTTMASEPHRPTNLSRCSDDNDDEEEEDAMMEEKECFRTQSAAEILSTFASTISRTTIEPNNRSTNL